MYSMYSEGAWDLRPKVRSIFYSTSIVLCKLKQNRVSSWHLPWNPGYFWLLKSPQAIHSTKHQQLWKSHTDFVAFLNIHCRQCRIEPDIYQRTERTNPDKPNRIFFPQNLAAEVPPKHQPLWLQAKRRGPAEFELPPCQWKHVWLQHMQPTGGLNIHKPQQFLNTSIIPVVCSCKLLEMVINGHNLSHLRLKLAQLSASWSELLSVSAEHMQRICSAALAQTWRFASDREASKPKRSMVVLQKIPTDPNWSCWTVDFLDHQTLIAARHGICRYLQLQRTLPPERPQPWIPPSSAQCDAICSLLDRRRSTSACRHLIMRTFDN